MPISLAMWLAGVPTLLLRLPGRWHCPYKAATTTIPIVAITADPIARGLVSSLARPDRNVTGISSDAGFEFYGKVLGLLAEAVPSEIAAPPRCAMKSRRFMMYQPSKPVGNNSMLAAKRARPHG
jgi:hypothetical protein